MKRREPGTTDIPESKCLQCGRTMSAVSDLEGISAAGPGSLVVCIHCGAVMMLGDDLALRGMTGAEMDEITSDPKTMTDLARMVRRVHLFRHSQG